MNTRFINGLKGLVAYLLCITAETQSMQRAYQLQCFYNNITPQQTASTNQINPLVKKFELWHREYLKQKAEEQEVADVVLQENASCNNLILILDPSHDEGFDGGKFNTQVIILAKALEERVAPILVTQYTVDLLYQLREFPYKIRGYTQEENINNYISDMNEVFKDWLWYAHKQADLMLLIPKRYVAHRILAANFDYENQNIKACGFDVSNLDRIDSESVANYIKKNRKPIETSINIVDAFISLFIDKLLGKWFVFLCGHGKTLNREPQTEKEYLEVLNYCDKKIETLNEQLKNGYLFFREFYEKQLESVKKEKKNYETEYKDICNTHERKIEIIEDIKNSTIGTIAGLCYNDFFKLICFLNKIGMSFFRYDTCYSGGFNQAVTVEMLSQIKANFIVSRSGMNEAGSLSSLQTESFTEFFMSLKNFFTTSTQNANQQRDHTDLPKGSLANIVGSITDREHICVNQPFIYLPSTGVFTALAVDKQTKILTHALARACELEEKIIDFSFSDTKIIFIYPSYVGATLKMKNLSCVVSPAPQKFDQIGKNNIHILEKVIYEGRPSSVIPHFVLHNINHENVIFVIKEVSCVSCPNAESDILNNVLLCVKKRLKEDVTDIKVIFTQKNSTWFFSTEIKNLENEEKKLFDIFVNITPTRVTSEILESFASSLFDKEQTVQLQKKELTVDILIKKLEAQIA